jgi:hypothetical protein
MGLFYYMAESKNQGHSSAKDTLASDAIGPSRMYKKILVWAENRGYYLRFNYDAKLTGYHSLYEEHNPSKDPMAPKSVKFPDWFQFLVPASEIRLETAQETILDEDVLHELSANEQEFAIPLFVYRSGRSSEITDHVLGVENLKAMRHKKLGGGQYQLGIAHSPATMQGCKDAVRETYAYVPEKDWFPEKLQELEFEDVIRIFPYHEAQMMKLIIGRACVGRTGSIHPGTHKIIEHGFRKAGVVIGEPGVGKTLTLNGILNAMKYVGYDVSSMGDFGSRFNQGSVVTSHLAYNDDLTLDSLERMLKAHSFKSVVTGGTEKVEQKGVDAIEVVANTAILANCNEWSPSMIYGLDSGAVSRMAPIATYRLFELEEISEKEGHDVHPGSHIRWLCKKYDTDPMSLYLRVLRDCTDFFLSHCKKEQDIHFYSEQLMPYLRIQLHKNALECFIRFGFLAYAIRQQSLEGDWLPELTLNSMADVISHVRFLMIDKRANSFRTELKKHWEEKARESSHPYWAQRKMLITSIDKAYEVFNTYKADRDVAIATENAFEVLRLRDGFSISKKMAYIVRSWETIKGERSKIYNLGRDILSKLSEEDKNTLFDGDLRTDSSWIYDSSYDPTSV